MADQQTLKPAKPVPALRIPNSTVAVKVSIIDTTTRVANLPMSAFLQPTYKDVKALNGPAFSFLIEHPGGRKIIFDLGVRKDHENLSPRITKRIRDGGWDIKVQKNVVEILTEHGVKPESIEAIIWSHFHWDHTGDPSTFPYSTSLVVGPGFKDAFLPAYPTNPESPILESDYANRTLKEITSFPSTLGRFPAHDYFGDGSFYLLNSPGHAVGHMCGLARTTASDPAWQSHTDDTFILMGGDCCHHGGEFRPTEYLPLPKEIHFSASATRLMQPCPGSDFLDIHPTKSATSPFYHPTPSFPDNLEECEESIRRLEEFDGHTDQVFTVVAHDSTLLDVVDFYPKSANEWREKGWAREGRWRFLGDFVEAVEEARAKRSGAG